MAQLERADLYLFDQLSHDTRKGVRGIAAGGLPLEGFVDKHLMSMKFNMLLCPLEKSSSSSGASSSQAQEVNRPKKNDREQKQERQIESLKGQVENLKGKQQGPQGQETAPKESP